MEEFEYDSQDAHKRLAYFYDAYQKVPWIPKPASYDIDTDDWTDVNEAVPDDEVWLQNAAYHASTAVLDALAGLIDILDRKAREDEESDEGFVFDDEA